MSLSHSIAFRNVSIAAGLALINAGSANASGIFRFRAADNAVVAGLPLSNPAFAAPVSGVALANAITADTNAVGGVIARATLEDRDRVVHCTVSDIRTTSGGDMQGNNLTVASGSTVQLLAMSYVAFQ